MGSFRLEVRSPPKAFICVWWADQEITVKLLQEEPASNEECVGTLCGTTVAVIHSLG